MADSKCASVACPRACIKPVPISKDVSCGKNALEVNRITIVPFCDLDIVLADRSTELLDVCTDALVSGLVVTSDPFRPIPGVSVYVNNSDDFDEAYEMSTNDDDTQECTYTINPNVKICSPTEQCFLESLEGECVHIFYEFCNKDSDFRIRYFQGILKSVSGGFKAGYDLSFEIENPSQSGRPKFYLEPTGVDDTILALEAITNF